MNRSSLPSICADVLNSHGNTLIAVFRRIYGASFAAGYDRQARLRDLSADVLSSHLGLLKDHMTGALATRVSIASELLQVQRDPTRTRPVNGIRLAL